MIAPTPAFIPGVLKGGDTFKLDGLAVLHARSAKLF